jgi:hypothetical protein
MTLMYPAKGFDIYAGTLTSAERQAAKNAGYDFIMHYYGGNSGKDLTAAELEANSKLGLYTGAVFEGGCNPAWFTADHGLYDAEEAIYQAQSVDQPKGSAIYFAYDFDPTPAEITGNILPYHRSVASIISSAGYKIGAYGAGVTMLALFNAGLLFYDWIGGAMGWAGSRGYKRLDSSSPSLLQGLPTTLAGVGEVDPDTAFRDAGLFILGGSNA